MKAIKVTNLVVDPEVLAVMQARARRARAEAVHNLVVQLVQKLSPRAHLRLWGAHWG